MSPALSDRFSIVAEKYGVSIQRVLTVAAALVDDRDLIDFFESMADVKD
ncbi:hypothetical protein [Brevibacillus reuszeri]|nr:hypothetical protein [Brevibacillus reuszeri]